MARCSGVIYKSAVQWFRLVRDSRITSNSMFQWTGKNKASVGFWPLADIPYVAFGGKADMPIALRKGAMCHMTQGGHCMIDHHKRLGTRFSFLPPLTLIIYCGIYSCYIAVNGW